MRFQLDRDPRRGQDVRDRVAQARRRLPEEANEPIVQKQEADAQPIIYLAFSSDRHDLIEIADVAKRLVKDRIQTMPGVAEAQVYGNRTRCVSGCSPTARGLRTDAARRRGGAARAEY